MRFLDNERSLADERAIHFSLFFPGPGPFSGLRIAAMYIDPGSPLHASLSCLHPEKRVHRIQLLIHSASNAIPREGDRFLLRLYICWNIS